MQRALHNNQQASSDNPGWGGNGVPSFFRFARRRFSQLKVALVQHESSRLKYIALATIVDFANYYTPKRFFSSVYCPCCGWIGPGFLATANWRAATFQSRCPLCDSRSRHRGLHGLLPHLLEEIPDGPVLVFAPERVILDQLAHLSGLPVVTTDLHSYDVDYSGEDIQHLSFGNEEYAMILCNHVLEHVPDDDRALQECARILKPGGIAIFTVPGDFPKRETWIFDKTDDSGHYRHYGMDIVGKMELAFPIVESVELARMAEKNWKVRAHDYAFVCRKSELARTKPVHESNHTA